MAGGRRKRDCTVGLVSVSGGGGTVFPLTDAEQSNAARIAEATGVAWRLFGMI